MARGASMSNAGNHLIAAGQEVRDISLGVRSPAVWYMLDFEPPPSVNAMFYSNHRKAKRYRDWQEYFGWRLARAKVPTFSGPYQIDLVLTKQVRGDVDNRLKALLDTLVKFGVTPDDKHCVSARAKRAHHSEVNILAITISSATQQERLHDACK